MAGAAGPSLLNRDKMPVISQRKVSPKENREVEGDMMIEKGHLL